MTRHNAPQATGRDKTENTSNDTRQHDNAPDVKNSVTKCYTVLDVPVYSVAWYALKGVIARKGNSE